MAAYLSSLDSLKGVKNVTVAQKADGKAGEMEITFEADFTPTKNAIRTGSSFGLELTMPADEKDILKYVYNLEDTSNKDYKISYIAPNGTAQITETEHTRGMELIFDHDTGYFSGIGGVGIDTATLTFNSSASSISGEMIDLSQFSNVDIDFSSVNNFGNGKKCTLELTPGSKDSTASGKGRKIGELIGIEIGQDGRITASYDNGLTKLLGQIAVAEFANASGLAKAGNNLYSATQNSGEFDGVGKDITASGGSMTSGVLEMSNVDLSSEFTTMITTQRGFQANSRIITTSDTLLEELVNLKR
ncbi:MAG: flagellar hook-basal body complex protein [Lachnospiraceae bacterium]|nr:flagellar hook-basal body complex protein [Lachnospiraceae bacterium]